MRRIEPALLFLGIDGKRLQEILIHTPYQVAFVEIGIGNNALPRSRSRHVNRTVSNFISFAEVSFFAIDEYVLFAKTL